MTDCWLDPYGVVYDVPRMGGHEDVAMEILKDEFPMENRTTPLREGPLGIDTWDERGFRDTFENTLSERGWARYTTTMDIWAYNPDRRLTRAQLEKIYELGGRISRYTGYPFDYEEYERG